MYLFTRNSPYYHQLKYLLFLLKHPVYIYIYIYMYLFIYVCVCVCVCICSRELISGPNLSTGARVLSSNRTQSRVLIGLLTRHNTLRRHFYIMGLSNNPICRKCGTEEETSVHILCECETLVSLRYTYLCSFFLDPEDIMELGMGAI
jgi:hypothetical protein